MIKRRPCHGKDFALEEFMLFELPLFPNKIFFKGKSFLRCG